MTRFSVPDMTCGHCKSAIEAAVASVDPKASMEVDLGARIVSVTSKAEASALVAAMKAAGYDATVAV